jgi:hypothetical protein
MTAASFSGAITWYCGLRKQQADVQDAVMSGNCLPQQAFKAQAQWWFTGYNIFRPVALISGSLALVVPLLRLFDISNISTGSANRNFSRTSRAIVAFFSASCFALSLISCWYNAYVSSRRHLHFSANSEALCSVNSSLA